MLAKAPRLGADELVLDLEDSVAPGVKSDARNTLAAFLQERPETPALAVRVNALDSHWFRDDVMVLVQRAGAAIDTLVLPKVESAADLEAVDGLLDDLGEPAARIRSQALIETAAGLLHAGEIAYASERLDALVLGYADLAASLGRRADPDPGGWLHAQETVLVAARAAGVQAIDGPYLAIRDREGCGGASTACVRSALTGSGPCIPASLRSSARPSPRGPRSSRGRTRSSRRWRNPRPVERSSSTVR